MKQQSLLEGALILTVSGFINRILGFILRILIVRQIGDEGLGLFQMVYPIYITLLLLGTAGFPAAIAKLIPERLTVNNKTGAFNYFKITIITVGTISTLLSLTLFSTARYISTTILSDPRTFYPFMGLIPALIICPLSSGFKGFFQGYRTMIPTAVSQFTEQTSRLGATLAILSIISHLKIRYQATGIALGISIGEAAGLLILIYIFICQTSQHNILPEKITDISEGFLKDIKEISSLALPITAGRIINSLMQTGEAIIIPKQLQLKGHSINTATSLYGQLSGMVIQVIGLPTVITIALATSLIPSISKAHSSGNKMKIQKNFSDILKISSILGIIATVIFISKGKEICNLLFGHPEAGILLSGLTFSAPFIYFLHLSSGMLNGLGHPGLSVRNITIGSLLKLLAIYFLTPHPAFGIRGVLIGITAGCIISALLNFLTIGSIIGFNFNKKLIFIKPMVAGIITWLFNPLFSDLKNVFPEKIYSLIVLILITVIYFLILIITGVITKKDLERFKR